MSNAIEANSLTKTYPGDVRALEGLDLEVERGTVYALLGPNGAGKSTTVRILTTLAQPDSGSARVAGIDVLADPDRVRSAIGVVGQQSGGDAEATGRENLILHAQLHGLRDGRTRADELLRRFDLAEAADRLVRPGRAGCRAGSPSRWASSTGRRCSSSMNQPPDSTRRCAPACGSRSA